MTARRRRAGHRRGVLAVLAVGCGVVAAPGAVLADQQVIAADNARVDCRASRRELTRFSLVGDDIAAVSKVSSGIAETDFAVVHEPITGDIYLSVPEAYAAPSLSFFVTSKTGMTYKVVCAVADVEAQQVFVANPALAKAEARAWEQETPLEQTAVRLIRAMWNNALVGGYEVRQPWATPVPLGAALRGRLLAEYRGAALTGRVLRVENVGQTPLILREADFAVPGTVAVTLARAELAPGAATQVYVVAQSGVDPALRR